MTSIGWLLLLLVVVALVAYGVVSSRRRPLPPAPAPVLPEPDELASLGLSPVRSRPASEDADPDEARFEDVPRGRAAAARAEAPPSGRSRAAGTFAEGERESARRARDADDSPWVEAPVRYLLRSLAAQAGGPVAVVRHDGERFQVEARTDGGPRAPVRGGPLVLDRSAAAGSIAGRALDAAELGGLAALVGGQARAVRLGEHVVLIGGRGPAAEGYLDLLAALTGAPAPSRSAPPAEGAAPAAAVPADEPGEDAPVLRATIIAEEQAAADEAVRPLAFALVTLADAEERLTGGTAAAVAAAEAELRDRLLSAPDVRRVEPFGDLLFGVFLELGPRPTAAWCDRLASGEPPLFIGAVAPAVGDANGIRDAAVEALHDAYDQRRARVVEV